MKKFCIYTLLLSILCVITTACSEQTKNASMVKSQRRFEKYVVPSQNSGATQSIDLSDGPRLNYDAKFGPNSPNFDIKIVDPY